MERGMAPQADSDADDAELSETQTAGGQTTEASNSESEQDSENDDAKQRHQRSCDSDCRHCNRRQRRLVRTQGRKAAKKAERKCKKEELFALKRRQIEERQRDPERLAPCLTEQKLQNSEVQKLFANLVLVGASILFPDFDERRRRLIKRKTV
jgi:hypothetical protein